MQGQLVEHRQQRQLFVVAQTAQQLIDPRLVAGGNLLRQRLAAFGQPQDVPAPVAAALDLFQQPVRFDFGENLAQGTGLDVQQILKRPLGNFPLSKQGRQHPFAAGFSAGFCGSGLGSLAIAK